jgi:electron transport complex protein RnfA
MGVAVTFVMLVGSVLTYLFYSQVLVRLGVEYLQTIVFVFIIAAIVQFLEMYLKKNFKSLYDVMGIFLPLMTTNCAILGVALINIRDNYTFIQAVFNSAGAGLGFLFAIVLIAAIREKYENHPDISSLFQGFPLALFSAGLMSIAFMGFQGLI